MTKLIKKYQQGSIIDDEIYYGGNIEPSIITTKFPDIKTKEGKRLASKLAIDLYNKKITEKQIPISYKNYIKGQIEGAIPTSQGMDKAGRTVAKGLTALASIPLLIETAGVTAPILSSAWQAIPLGIRNGLGIAGDVLGIAELASKNGIRKTIKLANKGDRYGALKSGAGDALNILGLVGTTKLAIDTGKKLASIKSAAITVPQTTKLSLAERLGIPKANRNQFDRLQQEALSDLDDFINNKLPTKEYPKLEQAGDDWYRGSTNKGWLRFNKDRNSIFFRANDVDDWGEATATVIPGRREGVIKLTSPYADASYNISPEELPDLSIYSKTLPKDMVKRFWSGLDEYVPHKTYVSGDAGELPLGHDISNIYEKMHSRNRSADDVTNLINKLTTKQKYLIRTDGLSTDSYMSILKQGNRDGKALRFSNDGFTVFNEQGVKYKYINDLLKKQKVGEISNEEFIKAFDNWVKPYNGMSPIVKNGTIVIPHPFVLYKKIGGMLKC